MCAISGIINLSLDEGMMEEMLRTMQRRGPDGSGIYQTEGCALLHSRLAIIDPAGGTQPMIAEWGGEKYVIVYNGELYNTAELRNELVQAGHHFHTQSDTEVVLHGYMQWKERALLKYNGIYSLAIWEQKNRKLFLARDRMGVKPLFFKEHDGGFLFASEIKTIMKYPTVKAELDDHGIGQIFLLGPGREPGSGVIRGIYELEPGCYGVYRLGNWNSFRYWKLYDREHTESFEETAEHVKFLVEDAIRRQMISDVPVGTFLSGGLDSSLITAVCAKQMKSEGKILNTFSVDYENNDRYFIPGKFQPNSDSEYIHVMCDYLNAQHHLTVLTPEDLVGVLKDATIARDLPGMADVDFSLLAFCREIRGYVKVALSGECADEIFGGYPWYRDPQIRSQIGFPWAQNTKKRAQFLSRQWKAKHDPESFVQDCYMGTIQQTDILPGTTPTERRMKEMVNLNYRWFMQTLLDRKDRMSMYSGLEVRVPFCDHRIAEYLYGVPWEYKDYNGMEKGLLRFAMKGVIPDQILYRKKSPYPKTYDPGYMKLVSASFNEMLRDNNAPIFQIADKSALNQLLTISDDCPWYGQLMKVPQTIAYMLQINYWMKEYKVQVI